MHVYCINLARRPDRRARAEAEFFRAGLEVEFFDGTDGWRESPGDLHITPGEYGCALSHVRVWRDMVARRHRMALVLEDDVELSLNFKNKLNEVLEEATLVPGWDVIFIGYILPIVHKSVTNGLFEGRALATHSYLISLECAQKLAVFDPRLMRVGIDFQLNRFPLKILCTRELLTNQGDDGIIPYTSVLTGDIGTDRTLDLDFFARLAVQNARGLMILLVLNFIIKLIR